MSSTSSRRSSWTTQKREAILHKMQQIVYERTIYAPIWQLAFINGVGPRVGESGFGLIARFPLHRALRGHHAEGRLGPLLLQ